MRTAWRGIQAYYAEKFAAQEEELDELEHTMLVSGRRAKIRMPGAKGDSTLEPVNRQRYVEDDGAGYEGRDYIEERNAAIRGGLGGDALSWRSQATRRGVGEDDYGTGKSFAGRRSRGFTAVDLVKSFSAIKSKLRDAMFDEQIEPAVLMNFEAAGTEPHLGFNVNGALRALDCIRPSVRKAYGIPSISGY